MGRPRRERGSAKLRTCPHSAPTKLWISVGTGVRLCGWIVPSASGCQKVESSYGGDGRVDDQGLVARREGRVGVVQRLVRAVVPAGGDRGRGDPVSERRRRPSMRGGEVGRVAERTQLSRQQGEGSAQVRVEGRSPEEHAVGGVADRGVAGGRALRSAASRPSTSRGRRRRGRAPGPARWPRRSGARRPPVSSQIVAIERPPVAGVQAGRRIRRRRPGRLWRGAEEAPRSRRPGRRERCAGRSARPTGSGRSPARPASLSPRPKWTRSSSEDR